MIYMPKQGKQFTVYQSMADDKLWYLHHNDVKIELKHVSATPTAIKMYITIAGEMLGLYNILAMRSIKDIYNSMTRKLSGWANYFKDIDEFESVFLKIGQNLKDGNYEYEDMKKEIIPTKDAIDFLKQPDLIDQIDYVIRNTGQDPYCGEYANTLLIFLTMLSKDITSPLNLEVVGPSSLGKTYMVLRVSNVFPPKNVMIIAGATAEALKYEVTETDNDGRNIVDVSDKIMIILEKDESMGFVKKLKPIASHDRYELPYKVPTKNDVTGERRTVEFVIRGWPSIITLTTQNPDDVELLSRVLVASPTASMKKLKEVITAIFDDGVKLPSQKKDPKEHKILMSALSSIRPMHVINPFLPLITKIFPTDSPQRQRDAKKLRSMIEAVTVLHQYQRLLGNDENTPFLVSSFEDNVIGLSLIDLTLESTFTGVPKTTMRVYNVIRDMNDTGINLTVKNIYKRLSYEDVKLVGGQNALYENHIKKLIDMGWMEGVGKIGKGSKQTKYTIPPFAEEFARIPKITPLFVEMVQDQETLKSILTPHLDIIMSCEPPDCEVNLPRPIDLDFVTDEWNLLKYTLSSIYIGKGNKGNVVHRIMNRELGSKLYTHKNPLFVNVEIQAGKEKETLELKKSVAKKHFTGSGDWSKFEDAWAAKQLGD
jgi:hypothetical protein